MRSNRTVRIKEIDVGIIGGGYVGGATALLESENIRVKIYDKDPEKCSPKGTTISDLGSCHLLFICVPTPMNSDGSCDTDVVTSVIKELREELGEGSVPIVIRSTVPVGFCKEHGVNFMPEFLTERNWRNDVYENENWIVGTFDSGNLNFKERIRALLTLAFSSEKLKSNPMIHFVPSSVAEASKYVRNCFLATKVSFFNEMAEYCDKEKIPFDLVREIACLDDRIGESHTSVPGHDGKKGFGGTCFPKDMASLSHQMTQKGGEPLITDAVIRRNLTKDRPEKDWESDKGRAVSF